MLSKLLVKRFVKNSNDTENKNTRQSYGLLAGIVGIVVNIALFSIKLLVGLIVGSIAVMADAFNNLSDAASSIITIVGLRMSNKPADEEHPFGHGRIEYISALIVSFMVILVGFEFVKSSFERIINPEPISFELVPFLLILVSILLKFWLSRFNKYISKIINSSALKAASFDALGDVVTSSCVALSLLLPKFTTLPLDGYIGILVALAILYSGYSLVKETVSPLLGEAPDPELVEKIKKSTLEYEPITGIHDLIIHNYGHGKHMASIHAEIPADIDIMKIHDIIDKAEREISEKLGIYLVIHMDPVCIDCKEINPYRAEVEKIIKYNPLIKSMHDFRVVGDGENKNLIFDIVVNPTQLNKIMTEQKLKEQITQDIKAIHPNYNCIITVDTDFM
ncbi:cation diffusion facilitator transporter [Clostridium polyendosporum]|uniref:Cation diffusion facilitator transporter n=1 Tax=Clostridium polyendosporum TaxID=69208 RepID=A0A919S033_9CLOT|nr:cation diffusion facilitator family transporter [Clostridium polyendosporum]GIM28798.1 cation diffusion facilitator transporter [Clostridium polyendosporum]